jgi:hypothetical protein
MFRFTIRDMLWLTAFVAIAITWLMDRNAMRRERAELAKRESELTSRAKMWENEANRAEKRFAAISDRLSALVWALQMRDIKPHELVDANNNPISPLKRSRPVFMDDTTK